MPYTYGIYAYYPSYLFQVLKSHLRKVAGLEPRYIRLTLSWTYSARILKATVMNIELVRIEGISRYFTQ